MIGCVSVAVLLLLWNSLLHTHLRGSADRLRCATRLPTQKRRWILLEAASAPDLPGPVHLPDFATQFHFSQRKFKTLRKVQQAGGKLSVVLIKELVRPCRMQKSMSCTAN